MYGAAARVLFLCVVGSWCVPAAADAQNAWANRDIGEVAVGGSVTTYRNGRMRVQAEGTDVWSTADGFHFVYQTLAADGSITARVAGLQNTDAWAKGGLMLRQSLDPTSVNASFVVTPGNGIAFQRRTTAGGQTVRTTTSGTTPTWLRLTRAGSTVTAAVSANGTTWSSAGSASVPLQGQVYVGLAVTSRRASRLTTATFEQAAVSRTASAPAEPSGPVAAWAFDEGMGTVARDSVGTLNGTVSGATWSTAGRYGGALFFDGLDDVVTVSDAAPLDLATGMTVEAWVRPRTLSGRRTVAGKSGQSTLAYGLYAHTDVSRPAGVANIGGTDHQVTGAAALPVDTWSHVAVTYDGQAARVYVNGTLAGSKTVSGTLLQTGGGLRIGGNSVWGEWFHGRIDDVRIYNRALTASDIQSDMNTPVPSTPLADSTRPTVAIGSPAAGATVSGTVTIAATAADNVGVASVQFLVDGATVGMPDTTAPYSVAWDSTSVVNGSHALTAVARDAAGNQATSASVTVTVSNSSVVVNVKTVEFTSPDHVTLSSSGVPVVSGYQLEIWTAGSNTTTGTPYRTSDLGKPSATSTLITVNQETFLAALPKGQQFVATVRATGPGGSARSAASNTFSIQ